MSCPPPTSALLVLQRGELRSRRSPRCIILRQSWPLCSFCPVSCKGGSRTENPEGQGQLKLNARLLEKRKRRKSSFIWVGRGLELLSYCVPGKGTSFMSFMRRSQNHSIFRVSAARPIKPPQWRQGLLMDVLMAFEGWVMSSFFSAENSISPPPPPPPHLAATWFSFL